MPLIDSVRPSSIFEASLVNFLFHCPQKVKVMEETNFSEVYVLA